MQGIVTSFNNIAGVPPDYFFYLFAQYGSGQYGVDSYGADASAPNTGLFPVSMPNDPLGWALLIGGLIAITISIAYLIKQQRNKK